MESGHAIHLVEFGSWGFTSILMQRSESFCLELVVNESAVMTNGKIKI